MPKFAVDINGSRRYWNPQRHEGAYCYRSVTTVTGALPKPALLYWAANEVASYAMKNLEAWTGLPLEDQYDLLRKAPWRNRDKAGARGTTIHAVADNIMSGQTYEVEALIEPWIHALNRFVSEARPQPLMTEVTGYSEKTLTAGTFDLLCTLDAAPELGRVLIDWKTSKGVYEDMAVQVVGGYGLGFEYTLDANDQEVEWQTPDTCMIVHLQQDGYTARPIPMDRVYRRAFLACLEIRKWEDAGIRIGDPYAFKPEPVPDAKPPAPSDDELNHLRARLSLLDGDQRLELMSTCDRAGVTTTIKSMTVDDLDRVLGFMSRYEITDATKDRIRSRKLAGRPMA